LENRKSSIEQNFKSVYFLFCFIILLGACDVEKTVPDVSTWGKEYFPLERNSYRIYNVSIISYSILGEAESTNYQLKEVVSDSFLNLKNEYTFILNRYKKSASELEWKLDSVWTASMDNHKIVVAENNVPFVKMVFPVLENKQWNGNVMNANEEEKYRMSSVGNGFMIGDTNFENTITVLQMDNPDTILIRDKRWEIYAKNIGLIYKEKIQLKYCSELACIGEGKIDSGTKYRQELIEYGKE
jgi:hypothetical protein